MIFEKLDESFRRLSESVFDGHFFPQAGDAKWSEISQVDRNEIQQMQAQYHSEPYPARSLTGFLAFVEIGNRSEDEKPYFLRREKLCIASLAAVLGDDEAFRDVLDGIWCICEESSWVISAHNVNPIPGAPHPKEKPVPDVQEPYVDLFAAQTGMILALVSDMLDEKLCAVTPLLIDRIHYEITRRILVPFMKRDDFWWMGMQRSDLNNWTPWILSNILIAGCLQMKDPVDRMALIKRSGLMLDRWLRIMPPDGGCDEGAGYWNMAGGAMLDCLEIYEKVTGGMAVFWDEPLIRNILSFPVRAEIGRGWFINFADCDARPFLSGERIQAAGEHVGDAALISLGQRIRGSLFDELSDVPHFSRLLNKLFHPTGESVPEPPKADVWLPDLEVRIVRRSGITLAIKGGNNGENHNHNDVGSFMLYMEDEPVIADAGNMIYTAKTFSEERYTLWNVRSVYHNLPIIGDCEQKPGQEYAASSVKVLLDGLTLHLENAYDRKAGIERFERTAVLDADGTLRLQDSAAFMQPQAVTWVFMFCEMPAYSDGKLVTEKICMHIPEYCQSFIEQVPADDSRMRKSFPDGFFRVRIRVPETINVEVEFTVRRNSPGE